MGVTVASCNKLQAILYVIIYEYNHVHELDISLRVSEATIKYVAWLTLPSSGLM